MVHQFEEAHFFPNVATKMQYDELTSFSETNIIHYLAEVEEYISQLISYNA